MKHLNNRLLSLVLAICMVVSLAAPAAAAPASRVSFTKVDNSTVTADLLTKVDDDLNTLEQYVATDVVRVSIFLDSQSTIEAGYSVDSIASNSQAMAYRADLKNKQAEVTAAIEKALGSKLDVVWNLTLAANLISANVKFGQIEAIEKVAGVSSVLIENQYAPDVVKAEEVNDPSMSTSSAQIGSAAAWAAGYTGAGSRIAVIDTGADTDHQSLNPDAFQYSLAYQAGKSGMTMEEYAEYIDLLDAEEIASVAAELNAPVAGEAYINAKIPFGYNYVDGDLDVTHDNDSQGSHGSHVSGIATANAWLYTDEGFVNALETEMVQGVAPDAQLIAMKVFGKAGGAYDSDYMAAIEDAVILGCDAANLSLGSGNPGMSRNTTAAYQAIMESLTKAGIVVAMSAGNSGSWVENAYNVGYLYADDVSMQTNGSPGSFTNSLSVASVDNDGTTGFYVSVGDLMVVYNETDYSNEPFVTIAGEHEYVLIDGFGTAEDWAAVGEALTGKIAICSRGTTSFFEKAQLAVEAGAIATFIYNNQAGIINMDLTDYPYTEPVASITQANGLAIKAASTPVTDEAGNVLYYTGSMTVSDSLGNGQFNSPYYTMSSFSSWGVPGSLELKPEITAPGGSIYSINGVDPSGTAYEVMSGTSMASPQVAGMAAIVAQYIRENGLEEQTGLTARQLAQSLLMSTAEPMLASASGYYSVMQQGAGLGNVGAAVSADSYITMADGSSAGAADGKVKVELGDDPDRDGSYTTTFTINNLTGMDKAFDLSADFFIQAPTSDGVNMYMYTSTALIGADVQWIVDGQEITPAYLGGMDFNGDGVVNSDDGMAILNYATGIEESLTNMDKADLDADGDVDSYDAYLFLSDLTSGVAMVPAYGSAEVTVNFSLSQLWKNTINYYYPNGTYIQGYIFAESLTDAEGVAGTSHSIPVLGFFGNWTDASMFDVGTYAEFATGDETRMPYLGNPEGNTFLVTYANEPDSKYIFGGNPLVPDDTYMPERNAINSADKISGVSFIAIRNAAASKFEAVNETTGELLGQGLPGAVSSAYFYVNGGVWRNTGYTLNAEVPASGAEGDVLSMALTLAPEYYVDAEGNVAWNELGEGATLSTTMVIDNTAPELYDVSMSLTGNTMTVTASDNEYVAAVALYNKAGTKVLTYTGAKQDIEKGETAAYTMDLSEVNGKKFLLQVMDYAMNTTTYVVDIQIGEEQPLPEMIAFDLTTNYWTNITSDTVYDEVNEYGLPVYAASDLTFMAATIVDHIVLAATADGALYAMPEEDLTDMTYVNDMGTILSDMAYNKADGNVYGVNQAGDLVIVDKLTAEVTTVGTIGISTNTLACDAEGNFYCNAYGTSEVYTFTLGTIAEPALVTEVLIDEEPFETAYIQAMEINPNTGMLCWTSLYVEITSFWGMVFEVPYAYYIEVDPATGEFTVYEDLWDELCALIIPESVSGGGWAAPTDEVTDLVISESSISLLKGGEAKLTATVLPWTATDRSVTWTSADETIATVNEHGVVTAVGVGETVITATSNLDPSFSVSCTVSVEALKVTINGTLQDENGTPMFYSWNMESDTAWTGGTELNTSMTSATYSTKENAYYIMDAVSNSWAMHKVGEDGVTIATAANGAGVPLWDMAYSEYFSEVHEVENITSIYYYFFLSPKDPMALNTMAFNLSSYAEYLTGIASMGYEQYWDDEAQTYLDTEHIVLLANDGTVFNFWIYETEEGGTSAWLNYYPSDLPCEFPGDDAMENMYCSLVAGDDGALYLSAFNGETNELFRLTYDESKEMYVSASLGSVGQDVWPATITSVTSNVESEAPNFTTPKATMHMDASVVSDEELRAASSVIRSTDVLNVTAEAKAAKAEMMAVEEEVAADETTVIVDITADVDTTNGVFEITWDPEVLELAERFDAAGFSTVLLDDGSMTFGFVSLTPVAAGETITSLTFNVKKTETTTVTVDQKQINNASGEAVEIVVEFAHANTEVRDAIAATCTTAGYTGDTYCTDCGTLVAKGEIIEALGHDFSDWTVTKAATCTDAGEQTRTCNLCGETETETIAASGHAFGEWTTTKEANCTENGEQVRTCECGETETKVVPALGHDYATETVEATCTIHGYTVYTCTVCGDSHFDDYTAPLGHAYEAVVTAPTCTEAGYTTFTCTVCGDTYVGDETAALGHSYEAVVTEPTCTEAGYTTYTCSVCGDSYIADYVDPDCASAAFADVTVDDWYHEAVDYVVEAGLMKGIAENAFAPGAVMNRAQIVTVLYRMAGSPAVTAPAAFTDVPADSFYTDAVAWAMENGITSGVSADKFAPTGSVTREQMVTFLYRYVKSTGADVTVSGDLSAFEDAANVSTWAVEAMTWAVEKGVISGVTATTLEPASTTNRAQVATVLMRMAG